MATAKFYWYPGGEGHLEELEIPDVSAVGISDLQYNPVTSTGTAYGLNGQRFTAVYGGYDEITLVLSNFYSEAFRRRLEALQRHLLAGYAVSFAVDSDHAWAAFVTLTASQDDTIISTTGNAFAYNPSAALSNGDEVLIQHPPPNSFKAEPHLVDSVSGTTVTLQTDLVYSYPDNPTILRHRDFYPVLYCSSPGPLVTSDRNRVYSFAATLRMSWSAIVAMYDGGGQGTSIELDTTNIGNGRNPDGTLDDVSRYQPWKVDTGAPTGWGRR